MNLQESIRRILREELSADMIYPDFNEIFDNLEMDVTNDKGTIYVTWRDKDGENVFSRNHWGRLFIHQ